MTTPRDYLHYWVPALVLLGCSVIAVTFLDFGNYETTWRAILIGMLFGTMFAQTIVASVWTVTGPVRFVIRVPLALLWIVSLVSALPFHFSIFTTLGPELRRGAIPIMGACLLGQWLVAQIPVWICTIALRVKLRRSKENETAFTLNERQFSIRQLMIVTTVIAVILGIGRVLVSYMVTDMASQVMEELPMFIAITVVAILISLPLMLAAMLRRYTVIATSGILLLIAIATPWEVSLISLIQQRVSPDPAMSFIFACINAVTAIWILLFVFAVRMNGYQLMLSSANKRE